MPDDTNEWWTQKLLGQQTSAHPVFGRAIHVEVDGPVVTLSGEVEDIDEARALEQEAMQVQSVESVVNHLVVRKPEAPEHMQTVIAVFSDHATAQLACRTISEAKTRDEKSPDILVQGPDYTTLRESMDRAHVPDDRLGKFLSYLEGGKVLLMDRVPEDDIFQVVSALEGTPAESIVTLPPEPEFYEEH